MLESIRKEFETAFDLPFLATYGVENGNLWYIIGPEDNHKELFTIKIAFKSDVRLNMEFIPAQYSAGLIRSMGKASIMNKAVFASFAKVFLQRSAKITFLINHNIIDETMPDNWQSEWEHILLRISRAPITTEKISYEKVILDWGVPMMGMVLSLLDIVSTDSHTEYESAETEGSRKLVLSNRYERSALNRALCLAAKGYTCSVCSTHLEDKYGILGRGFIHVHHVVPVSEMGENYVVDPLNDLEPVCPNCHSMIHRMIPPLSIDDVKRILVSQESKVTGGM